MNLNIKNIENKDIRVVYSLFNLSMNLENINYQVFEDNIINDKDFESVLTLQYTENDAVLGFIMGVIRKRDDHDMGYIKFLFVHPEYRRKGIGKALYKQVENVFIKRGIKKVRLFESYPDYYMPGLDPFYTEAICFFEREKYYRVGDCSNLETDLNTINLDTEKEEAEAKKKGVDIMRASVNDKEELLDWTNTNFKAWISEVGNSFINDPISVHIARLNGKIIAFSAYETNNRGTGWFGPMGTTTEARGKGLGGILLLRCLKDIKSLGFSKAIIPWVGPIPFYMHYSNSKVKRVFWRYEKELLT